MSRTIKKVISYIVLVAMVFSYLGERSLVYADENIDEGKCGVKVSYILDNQGTLTISGSGEITNKNWSTFKDSVKKVIIEDGVENIPTYAFYGYSNLEEVSVGANVNNIGSYVFSDCKKLNKITISEGVKALGQAALSGCSELEEVVIPNSVTTIEDSFFEGCTNLKNIKMSEKIETVGQNIIKDTAFYKNQNNWEEGLLYCDNVLIDVESKISGEVSIKEGTRVIGAYAFFKSGITGITFPGSLVSIGNRGFCDCKSLSNIQFSEGLKSIGANGFYGNALLKKAELPDTVEEIGDNAFASCVRLQQIHAPKNLKTIGDKAFYDCNSIESFTIPNQVISIGNDYLKGCTSLTTLYAYTNQYGGGSLPENLEKIYGFKNSYYENYAKSNGIDFVEIIEEKEEVIEKEEGKITITDDTEGGKEYKAEFSKENSNYVDYANKNINNKVTVSGCGYNNPYDYSNLIDGNLSSYWQVLGVTDIYVIVNFGEKITFENMTIAWMELPPHKYEVSISDDGKKYEQIIEVSNGKEMRTDEIELFGSHSGKYVKISYTVDNNEYQYNHSIREISVYGREGQIRNNNDGTTKPDIPETTSNVTGNEETTTADKIGGEQTTGNGENQTSTSNENNKETIANQSGEKESERTHNSIDSLKIISVKEKNYHTAAIKWTTVTRGYKYQIYRATSKSGKYKKIAEVEKNTYNDKKVKASRTYFYKIKAVNGKDSYETIAKKIRIKGRPNKPDIKVSANAKRLKIKWGTLRDNSTGIQIYVKSKKGGFKRYTKINETTKLKKSKKKKGVTGIESAVAGLKKNVEYSFKARTYAKISGGKVYSKWSKVKKITIK